MIARLHQPRSVAFSVRAGSPGFDEWFVRGTAARPQSSVPERQGDGGRARQARVGRRGEAVDRVGRACVRQQPAPQVSSAPAARAISPIPGPKPSAADELQLTTGARAVMASGPVSVRSGGSRTTMLVLGGLAALVVIGVGGFVAIGGAAAFRDAKDDSSAAAAIEPPAEAQPVVNPAPVLPPPSLPRHRSRPPQAHRPPASASAALRARAPWLSSPHPRWLCS